MRTALFWIITQRIVVIFTDVSGQPISPIFRRRESPRKKVRSSHLLRGGSLKSHFGGSVVFPSCCSYNNKPNPYKSAPTTYEGKSAAKPRYLSMKAVHEVQTRVHRHVRWASEPVWALCWREQYPSGRCVETLLIPQLMTCWLNTFLLLWNFSMRNKSESTGFWKRHFLYRVYELSINLVLFWWWRRLQWNNYHHHHHKHQGLDPLIRSISRVIAALANVF